MRVYKTSYKTEEGKGIKCKIWRVKGRDNLGTMRFFSSGCKDKKAADDVANRIDKVIEYRDRLNSKPELLQFLRDNPKIREKLIGYQILDEKNITVLKPLHQHIEDFCDSIELTDVTNKRVKAVRAKLKQITESCGFKTLESIKAEAVQDYLAKLRNNGKGISHRTHNVYLQTLKQFCHWMVQDRRASESPIQYLKSLNVETDRRRRRKALSIEEIQRLLRATRDGPARFGMTGYERHLLYWFAAETGLRANEIRTLKIKDFNLEKLTVTVQAGYSKHRREDIQPLKSKLAAELKEFFKGKLPEVKAFGGSYKALTKKTANMLKEDLAEAKIPYTKDGEIFDFHALRHTFITNLRFAPSRYIAQSLARHRSSAMTDRYMHIELQDERAALENLPDISPSTKKQKEVAG